MRRYTFALALLPFVLLCSRGVVRSAPPPTLDQIIAGLARTEELVFGAEGAVIVYELTTSKDITPTQYSGGWLPAEWTLAFRGDMWFVSRTFTEPYETESLVVSGEPWTAIVKDGHVLDWPKEFNRASLEKFDLGFNVYDGWNYTLNMSLDAPKHIASTNGAKDRLATIRKRYRQTADQPFLPEFLVEHKDNYRVLPNPEEVEGITCWIVEWPEMDRFWVAPSRGFAVPRRQYNWGPGKPRQFELHNSDYRDIKAGLWLPFSQKVIRYADIMAEDELLWGKPASEIHYKVKSIEYGNVDDSLFDVTLPPGTMVYDIPRQFNYVVPDSSKADPFAFPIVEAQQHVRRPWRIWLIVLNIVVVMLVVIMCGYRVWFGRARLRN